MFTSAELAMSHWYIYAVVHVLLCLLFNGGVANTKVL